MDVITFPVNRQTTSGLQILLYGVILLSDATSYDKHLYRYVLLNIDISYFVHYIPLKLTELKLKRVWYKLLISNSRYSK